MMCSHISTEEWEKKFETHLNYNERIIFSAKFGDGKTFFLNQFKHKCSDKYLFITIYPIHYQLESSINILELIKRDILYQFLKKDLVNGLSEDNLFFSKVFCKETLSSLAEWLEKAEQYIGVPACKAISNIIKTGIKCHEFIGYNTQSYVDKFQEQPGIYESDCFTLLIKDIIENYKKCNHRKKVVLIIEDFDRIDPAHIFRILNTFSAHIDRHYVNGDLNIEDIEDKGSNKFGFDKIITVCDYHNLERIFNHVYGEGVSFKGYISKFVTHQPFEYSLAKLEHAQNKISQICKLDIEFVRNLSIVNEAIEQLSIRDIVTLFEHIDDDIKEEKITAFGCSQVSSRCSLTRFFCLLLKLFPDRHLDEIVDEILKANPIQVMNLIDIMWGTTEKSSQQISRHVFYHGKDICLTFNVIPDIQDGELISVKFEHLKENQPIGNKDIDYVSDIFQKGKGYIVSLK